jgi:hypothetical protein
LSWTLVLRAGEVQQVASLNGISWHQPGWRYLDLNQAANPLEWTLDVVFVSLWQRQFSLRASTLLMCPESCQKCGIVSKDKSFLCEKWTAWD